MHFGFDPALKPIKQDLGEGQEAPGGGRRPPTAWRSRCNGPQGRYVRDKEVAEAVAGQLTKAGIKTTVRTYEFVNYLNNMVYVHKAGPVWLIGWGTPTMDAETVYVPLFRSGTSSQLAQRRLQPHGRRGPDDHGREEAARAVPPDQQAAGSRTCRAVPLYQQIDLYGVNKRLNWKARSDERLKAYDMSLKEARNVVE